jgi:DNA-cytosine methyltransferase
MIVLSLFDGMSCGRIALERAGIPVTKYYASEIDKYAQIVSEKNYPDIIRLGDITKWREWDIDQPDIIIGGSPCQGFSFAGKRLNLDDPRSKLFFEFRDIVKHYKPKYFLLENVRMDKESENVISREMGIQPVMINSALVSAQNRQRLYWTNIGHKKDLFGEMLPGIEQPKDKKNYLNDIIENGEVDRNKSLAVLSRVEAATAKRYKEKSIHQMVKCGAIRGRNPENPKSRESGLNTVQMLEIREDEKTNCLTSVQKDNVVVIKEATKKGFIEAKPGDGIDLQNINSKTRKGRLMKDKTNCLQTSHEFNIVNEDLTYRKLTPIECERLQTVPDNYTNHVSNSQRYKMLGNGWTVDVIVHILKHIKD